MLPLKRIRFFALVFSSACSLPLHAQTTFEASYKNGHNGAANLLDVTHLPGDNIAVIGTTIDSVSQTVYLAAAFQPNGSLLWDQFYSNTLTQQFDFRRLRSTPDGGLLVHGYISDAVSGTGADPFLMKKDSTGQTQWTKVYKGVHSEYALNMRCTRDGGYVCGGYSYGFNVNQYCYYLLKTDSAGNREWGKLYLFPYQIKASLSDVYEDENGDYYACGNSGDTLFFMKVSRSGAFRWAKKMKVANALSVDPRALTASRTPGAFLCAGSVAQDAFALEMDTLGNLLWTKLYGSCNALEIITAPGSGYVIAGQHGASGMAMSISSSGVPAWSRSYPASQGLSGIDTLRHGDGYAASGHFINGQTHGYLLRSDSAGKLYCNENSLSISASTPNVSEWPLALNEIDYFTAEPYAFFETAYPMVDSLLCAGVTGVAENESESAMEVWPVPADDRLFIELPEDAQWSIQLIDALGKNVLKKTLRGKTHELSVKNFPRGMYFLQAQNTRISFTKKILLR